MTVLVVFASMFGKGRCGRRRGRQAERARRWGEALAANLAAARATAPTSS